MTFVPFLLQSAVPQVARVHEVRVATHEESKLRVRRRGQTRDQVARLVLTSMDHLMLHQILRRFRRVVALGAFEPVIRPVQGHVILQGVQLEVTSRTLGTGEHLVVASSLTRVARVAEPAAGAFSDLDHDPRDSGRRIARVLIVRLDAGGRGRRITLRLTVQGQ